MGKRYPDISGKLKRFIEEQAIFFVGTAAPEGRINISPKGMDSLRVVDSNRVVWLNVTGSGLAFWDWSIKTGKVVRNDRWATMLGYSSIKDIEETTNAWADLIHPGDREAALKSIRDHLEGRTESHRLEYRILNGDGNYSWVLDRAMVVKRDADGKPLRMCGTQIDISDRKVMENDLLLSEERLKMVLEGSEQGFWDWNIATNEVKRNDRWAQMLGYSTIGEFEDTTDTWTNSIHPDDRDAAWKSITNHLEGRTASHDMEYRMLTREGDYRWIHDHAKIVQRDADGRPLRMSGTHIDITDRKQLEQEREDLIRSLREAMDEIRTLKGIIPICSHCHSIRNDEGAWDRIEAYLSRRADAEFSHGICPKCEEKVRKEAGLDASLTRDG